MDIKNLKIFVEIVNCESFTLAADRLFMTQPTLSKSIKHLEEELGTVMCAEKTGGFNLVN